MAPGIIYEDVTEGAKLQAGNLFEGCQFWVAQRVPSRNAMLGDIKANGGTIVQLEKQADYVIVDHFRPRECPPGSVSYTFVKESIRKGEIQDPNEHSAGPRTGTVREPSVSRPSKSTRNPFTPEEDRILYRWARAAQQSGIALSGNELYKQLEALYPSHTYHSWRDRYIKKLQYMPPSAFNITDDAPLSPIRAVEELKGNLGKSKALRTSGPVQNKDKSSSSAVNKETASTGSSSSKEQTTSIAAVKRTGLVKNKDKAHIAAASEQPETTQIPNSTEPTVGERQGAGEEEYTVEQLAATFTLKDWEDLYAYVEEIDSCSREEAKYDEAWVNWAENRDNQTTEQWRQYYEKVVRPQWGRDPVSKRQQIKKRVEQRSQDTEASPVQSQNWSQAQDKADVVSPTMTVPSTTTLKHTALNVSTSATGPPSTQPNAQQDTSKHPRDDHESALKRIRGDVDGGADSMQTSRPAKVQRVATPPATKAVSTQMKSQEAASATSARYGPKPGQLDEVSQAGAQDAAESAIAVEEEDESNDPSMRLEGNEDSLFIPEEPEDEEDVEDGEELGDEQDRESVASSTDLVHTTPLPRPSRIPEASDDEHEEEEEEEDNDLPTPRAPNPTNAFDTQAILSPSQSQPYISALPRPPRSSSPVQQPESEASTTESLREFSGYIQNSSPGNDASQVPQATVRADSPSPSTTSTASAASDSDPDPPLETSELESFFTLQSAAGLPDAFVSRALRRTGLRPDLALLVLDAWMHERPLPSQRGIWSAAEDALVEKWEADEVDGGDDAAMRELVRKHGVQGWGGIVERTVFLRAYRGE